MEELHILLTPNKDHRKVFPDVPVVGFRNGKSLKGTIMQIEKALIHNRLSVSKVS